MLGVLLLVVGVVITIGTHDLAARSGGSYIIAYGPIVYGFVLIVRGLLNMSR